MTIKNIICIFGLLSIQFSCSQSQINDWENQHLTQVKRKLQTQLLSIMIL